MNRNNLKLLAATAAVLVAILLAIQWSGGDTTGDDRLLLPNLKANINNIAGLKITRGGEDNPTVINKASDKWVIVSRDNYPADIVKLRELLLALADAKIVENKTSNPNLYGYLGLQDLDFEGSKGVRLELDGTDQDYDIVIGNSAQAAYRYVRLAGNPQSWLIDKNPNLPASTGQWLLRNIVDIKADEVQSATISHPNGEEIHIKKESAATTDFNVANIPAGRELSYATVANGIAGVLSALTLDDVRRPEKTGAGAVTTTFDTFDGVRIAVSTENTVDEGWIMLKASSIDEEVSSVAAINSRVEGWQFNIPQYKVNQLTRRWEDILKTKDE